MATESPDRVLLPKHVIPVHYDLKISTNLKEDEGFKFSAEVGIDVDVKETGFNSITLHSKQLELLSASFVSEKKELKSTGFEFNKDEEMVTVNFEENLAKGEGTLRIEFTGTHNNEMAGFYRSGYTGRDGQPKVMISTQFEPLDARRCFPCFDEPAMKAEFTCALVVDEGLTALGNTPGKESKVADGPDKGRTLVQFEKTPAMSTYLAAFCVGDFDFVETTTDNGVKLRVYTPPGKKDMGNFALDVGHKVLDLYDGLFGERFPLPKMDMIAIPEFAMGAMENWGLVTYREVDILIDPDKASSRQKQRVASVVAHELAHQWFGNLVTMEWWNDLWLNEGFASWMQNHAVDAFFEDWKLWEQFIIETQADALNLDALASSHPIQVPIRRAQEVEEVFDIISYRKGGSVVRLIYAYLGDDLFFAGLKKYMKTYKLQNTVTYDLWNAWETDDKPVNKVMKTWTEQMGYPILTVISCSEPNADGEVELELEQKWFLADGSLPDEGKDKTWMIPMFVVSESYKEPELLELVSEQSSKLTVKVGEKGWIKLNGSQYVPMRVNYTEALWKKLAKAVAEKELSVEDRSALLMDALAITKAGQLNPSILLELVSAYKNELDYSVWVALAGVLQGLNRVLLEEKVLSKKFGEVAKSLLLPAMKKIGWEMSSEDGHLGKLLRGLLIGMLVTFAPEDPDVLSVARAKFESYVNDPKGCKDLPAEYSTSVFRLVLKNSSGSEEYDKLMGALDQLETTVEKKNIYLSLGFVKSPDLKMQTLDWTTSGVVKKQDFFYAIASVSISGADGLDICWKYFQDNFSKYEEMLKAASPSLMGAVITYSASGFTTDTKADEIDAFFKEHKTSMERKVAQIVEKTRGAAKFKAMLLESNEFKNFLNNYSAGSSQRCGCLIN